MKSIINKYRLIPSDLITILGAFLTLSGVYIFIFFDVTTPYSGHQTSTLDGSIKFTQRLLGLWGTFENSVFILDEASLLIYKLKFFIIIMALFPLLIVTCIFIDKKTSKIISIIITILLSIVYLVFNIKLRPVINSTSISNNLIHSLFGTANIVILLGLFLMLGGSYYTFYQYFKTCD